MLEKSKSQTKFDCHQRFSQMHGTVRRIMNRAILTQTEAAKMEANYRRTHFNHPFIQASKYREFNRPQPKLTHRIFEQKLKHKVRKENFQPKITERVGVQTIAGLKVNREAEFAPKHQHKDWCRQLRLRSKTGQQALSSQ